jgi:hypothetical protein
MRALSSAIWVWSDATSPCSAQEAPNVRLVHARIIDVNQDHMASRSGGLRIVEKSVNSAPHAQHIVLNIKHAM